MGCIYCRCGMEADWNLLYRRTAARIWSALACTVLILALWAHAGMLPLSIMTVRGKDFSSLLPLAFSLDAGKELPLHGSIGNTPAEQYYHCVESREGQEEILIGATIRQAEIFGERLEMKREWRCPIGENTLYLTDTIRNYGDRVTPHMILYHMNMGYPILSEEASLYIPSETVAPRDARAAEGLNAWNVILPPQPQFKEQCYYHTFRRDEEAYAAIFNPAVQKGVKIVFHPEELDCFTQWKMMGWGDYVMGLEPGNCYVEGRDVMREKGILKELAPGEEATYHLEFHFLEDDTSLSK